jgi:hypothetical protein
MKYPYDEAFSPPAPLLPIEIFVPEEPQQRTQVDAKLDTAADISAIPSRIVSVKVQFYSGRICNPAVRLPYCRSGGSRRAAELLGVGAACFITLGQSPVPLA